MKYIHVGWEKIESNKTRSQLQMVCCGVGDRIVQIFAIVNIVLGQIATFGMRTIRAHFKPDKNVKFFFEFWRKNKRRRVKK